MYKRKNKGFTLVEVLICVGIIGIIAAISIPALLSSTSEKALEAQRKALYSRMAQAFGQFRNLKLYELTANDSTANFITQGLSTVYKLGSICGSTANDLAECGMPSSLTDYYSETDSAIYSLTDKSTLSALNNITWGDLDTVSATFKTANGESIMIWYNPRCKSKSEISGHNLAESVCANMVYDVNGKNNAPNAYGEDIGYITVFYPSDPVVVAPILYNERSFTGTHQEMLEKATELELVPPSIEELISILINKNLTHITAGINNTDLYWSSTYAMDDSGKIWTAGLGSVATDTPDKTHPYFLVRK